MQEPEDHLFPTGQCRILLQSGQSWSGTPLLLSTRVCVWSRLDDGNDDTVNPVGGLFFQGCSTPTPPVARSKDEMLNGFAVRYSSLERWSVTGLQPPSLSSQGDWSGQIPFIPFLYTFFPAFYMRMLWSFWQLFFPLFVQQVKQNLKLRYLTLS